MWMYHDRGGVALAQWQEGQPDDLLTPQSRWSDLDRLVGGHPTRRWVVDVSSERMLTSEALTVIVGLVRRVQHAGGQLVFANASPAVEAVLRSMRLSRLLPLHPDVATACTAVMAG